MAGSINKVILLGRLGADPEIRVSQDGKKLLDFRLLQVKLGKIKIQMKKKIEPNGIRSLYFLLVLSEITEKYLKKRFSIYIEGQLRNRKYTDQSGMEKNIFRDRASRLQYNLNDDRFKR